MLSLLNRVSIRLQRWKQGIPWGAAHFYNRIISRYLEHLYSYFLRQVSQKHCDKVLEVGCGPGRFLIKLAETGLFHVIVGIDISRAMILISRKNAVKHGVYPLLNIVVADTHRMPFREKFFDLVVSTGTLHHIKDPETFFRECTRVLGIGGEAWIYDFSYDISADELEESVHFLRRPKILLKLSALLHGLPRRVFKEGYIRDVLQRASVDYDMCYNGLITKLILKS
ncbi:MAG: hypothetical protein B6U94_00055 [Thermofilum sp. ex4484_79]|nr:MAG: hypothetical protein B6U94_00055 [Thermofilum sp. ex4484_79]